MPTCAYCKEDRPATREHVIPKFLYEFQKTYGENVIGWNEVVERMVGGEAKVKDVCAPCNNGPLAKLDAYGKSLLTESGLLVHNYLQKSLILRFEYSQLLRWILKISFNSSRTDGAHRHLFEDLVPFMLGEESMPSRSQIGLIAYLAKPITFDARERADDSFRRAAGGAKTFNPFLVRICYGLTPPGESFTLRLVMLGPLIFYVPLFVPGTLPGHAAATIRRLKKLSVGAEELKPAMRFIELRSGAHSFLDLYAHQVQRTRSLERGA